MTPEQERAILAATAAGLDDQLREAYKELIALIREGVEPREAVAQVMQNFTGDMATTMAAALTAVMAQPVAADAVLKLQVGAVELSSRLWREADETGIVVQGIVQRHLGGFADARKLALDLFEGYAFRSPTDEPLQISAANKQLPRYLREALLSDPGIERDLAVNFARIQVNDLKTPALRAAYAQLLDAIATLEDGKGAALLDKRLEVAFYERVRYFAQRIAQTEIHRAFAKRQAAELMADADVEFVQIRRAPGFQLPCICVLYTGRDVYGLGAGVYPKAMAPLPPYHPYCRCVVSPRLDLTGRAKAKPADPEADSYFLNRLGVRTGARVMGSRAKLQQVLENGRSADDVYSQGKRVQILTVAEGAR
jgi:hypothetical protein